MVATLTKSRPDGGQRFPFIPLPKAIERARELYKVVTNHEVPIRTAVKTWGYAEKSSGGLQTAAALKAFGLLVDVPGAEVRKVRLTDVALRIIRDQREISPERDTLIQGAALRPPLHREIFGKYNGMPPSDEALKTYLRIDRGLKNEAVPEFIREFSATMAFAKVTKSDTIQDMEAEATEEVVREVSQANATSAVRVQPAQARPLMQHSAIEPIGSGVRREIFALDEGDVVLTFPENLSAESFEDLEGYLTLFLRKARRRAGVAEAEFDKSKPV